MSADTFSLFAVCALLIGLLAFKQKPTKELFAGMNFPMAYKTVREVQLPPTRDKPADFFAVSGNFQSSLPPRFSNTQYRARIRCAGLPRDEMMPFDPNNPLTHRAVIEDVGSECCKPPICGREPAPSPCIREDFKPSGCSPCDAGCRKPCCSNLTNKELHHTLPVTDMRTIQCMAGQQEFHKQERILDEAARTKHLSCQDAAMNPIVYDRLIYANARSRLRAVGTDWVRGDLNIVPVLPEANPESLIWGRPSVTPHLDLNRGAMHVLGGYDNESARKLQDLMNASVNGTLSTFAGVPLRNEAVTCDGNTDIQVSSFAAP